MKIDFTKSFKIIVKVIEWVLLYIIIKENIKELILLCNISIFSKKNVFNYIYINNFLSFSFYNPKYFTETLQIATISNRYWINIVTTSNPYQNDFDVKSTSKRGCYDKDSILALTLYQYHYDIITTLSFRYGFDVATIWIRCQNRYHFNVEYISKW